MINIEKVYQVGEAWTFKGRTLLEDGTVITEVKEGYDNKADAEKAAAKSHERFINLYSAYMANNAGSNRVKVGPYLETWYKQTFSPRVESTTRASWDYVLHNMLLPMLNPEIALTYMTNLQINQVLAQCDKISDASANACRCLLSIAMKDAVLDGYIQDNPMEQADFYKRKNCPIKILDKEQLKKFLLEASHTYWYPEILLALFCGLRKGEILGLKWKDIDMEAMTVCIERQAGYIYEEKETKDGYQATIGEKAPKTDNSYRVLRVPPVIINELKKRKLLIEYNKAQLGDLYHDQDYISCQENGMLHAMTAMNNAVTKICKRANVPLVTVHGLRHHFATILMEQGVELPRISALMGHASVSTTFEIYCDVMLNFKEIEAYLNKEYTDAGNS